MKGLKLKALLVFAMMTAFSYGAQAQAQDKTPQLDEELGQVADVQEALAGNKTIDNIPAVKRVIDCNNVASTACRKQTQDVDTNPTYEIDEQNLIDYARKHGIDHSKVQIPANDVTKDEPTPGREVVTPEQPTTVAAAPEEQGQDAPAMEGPKASLQGMGCTLTLGAEANGFAPTLLALALGLAPLGLRKFIKR